MILNMNTLSANLKPSSLNYLSNFKIMLGITIKRMKGMFLFIISLNVHRENQLKECKSPLQGQGDKRNGGSERAREDWNSMLNALPGTQLLLDLTSSPVLSLLSSRPFLSFPFFLLDKCFILSHRNILGKCQMQSLILLFAMELLAEKLGQEWRVVNILCSSAGERSGW